MIGVLRDGAKGQRDAHEIATVPDPACADFGRSGERAARRPRDRDLRQPWRKPGWKGGRKGSATPTRSRLGLTQFALRHRARAKGQRGAHEIATRRLRSSSSRSPSAKGQRGAHEIATNSKLYYTTTLPTRRKGSATPMRSRHVARQWLEIATSATSRRSRPIARRR